MSEPIYTEASAAYLAEYYRCLGSVARLLRLRSLAEGFTLLAAAESGRAAAWQAMRLG